MAKRIAKYLFLGIGVFVAGAIILLCFVYFDSFYGTARSFASVIFAETVSSDALRQRFDNNVPIRILVVSGHDDEYRGGYFNGTWESDLTAIAGRELYNLLKSDSRFIVFLARDESGYNADFLDYFSSNKNAIREFRDAARAVMNELLWSGIVKHSSPVYHNWVDDEISLRLYGINKWANDNAIDIVFHVHFNDVPRRETVSGIYSGFVLYVPDRQFSNYRASRDVAEAVYAQIRRYFPSSNYPPEQQGIIEDQNLIAVGANASIRGAAVLAEYGYIYEPQFANISTRASAIRELAQQTYNGIQNYFNGSADAKNMIAIRPYFWRRTLVNGMKGDVDVFAAQIVLANAGLYPPVGSSANDCPPTGNFGACTVRAVKSFQQRYGLPATGTIGPLTRTLFNVLYSSQEMR